MRPPEVLDGNFAPCRGTDSHFPYGYILTTVAGQETTPYTALMDTGSSLIIVVMDAAEELLNRDCTEIVSSCDHRKAIGGVGGNGGVGYAWKIDLILRSRQVDRGGMLIQGAWIYAVQAKNLVGYSALFGQKSGFSQRWFKQHNHESKRYWQLREWR